MIKYKSGDRVFVQGIPVYGNMELKGFGIIQGLDIDNPLNAFNGVYKVYIEGHPQVKSIPICYIKPVYGNNNYCLNCPHLKETMIY